tara:strand:- start:138 stop:833 length:696 start_codon:yes stop_codon:yes gene_type:complete
MFDYLFDLLNNKFDKRNFNEVILPSKFVEHQNIESGHVIKNWLFQSSEFRKWRITILDGGGKIQVFNTVAYPVFSNERPILGVDILWFGKSKKFLAVLDFQPLIQNTNYLMEYCSKLEILKNKFTDFDNQKMKNIYDADRFFSPWVIICRGNNLSLNKDLKKLFTLFLEDYFLLHDTYLPNKFLNSKEIKNKHIEYDQYSSAKDPADKLFKNFFGDEWTNTFIKDFLFTLS